MAKISVIGTGGDAAAGARAAGDEARAAAREAAPWIVRMARVGRAAKGVIYILIGVLALMAAVGSGGGATDTRGALAVIGETTAGRALLALLGAGLLAYMLYALISAATNAERRKPGPKGVALRIGEAGRGLAYGALGVSALRIMMTAKRPDGNGAERWTGRLMDAPLGRWLVLALGAYVIGYALYQFWLAARKDLRKRLHLAEAGPEGATWVLRLARFGIAARGVVFAIIGWLLLQAGMRHDPNQAGGIRDSLATIGSQPYGRILLGIIAAGLVAYGLWELANARYREMRVE